MVLKGRPGQGGQARQRAACRRMLACAVSATCCSRSRPCRTTQAALLHHLCGSVTDTTQNEPEPGQVNWTLDDLSFHDPVLSSILHNHTTPHHLVDTATVVSTGGRHRIDHRQLPGISGFSISRKQPTRDNLIQKDRRAALTVCEPQSYVHDTQHHRLAFWRFVLSNCFRRCLARHGARTLSSIERAWQRSLTSLVAV